MAANRCFYPSAARRHGLAQGEEPGKAYNTLVAFLPMGSTRSLALAKSLVDAPAQFLLVCSSWVPNPHKTEQGWR